MVRSHLHQRKHVACACEPIWHAGGMPQLPAQSFPHAWNRGLPILKLGVGMVSIGIGTIATGRLGAVGWVTAIGGFGLALALALPLLLRVPMVAFDERGLRARLPGFGLVPWADIERVRLVNVANRSLLVVERQPAARQRRRGGSWPRRLARLGGGNDLAAPLEGLTARPEQIVRVVQLALQHMRGAT